MACNASIRVEIIGYQHRRFSLHLGADVTRTSCGPSLTPGNAG